MCYLDYGGILSRQWEWVHKWSSSVWVATYRVLLTMPTEQSQWRPAMPPFLLSPLSQSWCCLFPDSGGEEQYGLLYPFPLCPCPTESALCQSVTNFSLHLAQIGLYVFCIHVTYALWSTNPVIFKNKFSEILNKMLLLPKTLHWKAYYISWKGRGKNFES